MRPVFIERKPRPERYAWLKDALGRKQNEGVAAHLLQIWFVGQQTQLLCDFLDGLGIKHDENGTMEEMPPPPPRTALEPVIDALFKKHDHDVVRVYLQSFQALDEKGWPSLAELLESDDRLRLAEPLTA